MKIPSRFEKAEYEQIPPQVKKLFEAIPTTKRGIYIHGEVGTGKTYIAYALQKKYDHPESGQKSIFWNTTELLNEIRADFDREPGDKSHVEGILMDHKGLVILDDVGSEKLTDWVAETFYLIINKRYNEMWPTIFTSNLDIQALADRIGGRIVSRIVEMCDVVELVGLDRRLKSAKERIKIKI